MSTPVIFTITPEGIDAAITQDSVGLSVELVSISAHLADGTEWGRFDLSGGIVEPTTHTARFSAILKSTTAKSAYKLKIWTSDDILFAEADSASPLVVVAANIDFAASFGLSLTGTPSGSVTISINPDDSVAQALMMQHVGAADPHPQYKAYADSLDLARAIDTLNKLNVEAYIRDLADTNEANTRYTRDENLQDQIDALSATVVYPKIVLDGFFAATTDGGSGIITQNVITAGLDLTNTAKYSIYVTLEDANESYSLVRNNGSFDLNPWNRSGTGRGQYIGNISWYVLQRTA